MSHWIIAPVILPALLAPLIALTMRNDLTLARVFSIGGAAALLAISLGLAVGASGGETFVYELGDWPAPFGIVLVLDRLSAMMLVLTGLLGMTVVLYAAGSGWDSRGANFHALFQFQLMGITGAFLTGDAFNLFVFFEVLLIASYGLMVHAGGGLRLRVGVQYVVMNLAGSTLFLFALGTLYATTGTLNMADLAVKAAQIPAEDAALLRVGVILLMIVFAVKAALVPVHFWLPDTYSLAPAPVAALFAIMTKVGAYALLRFYTVVFPAETEAVGTLVTDWLLPLSVLTLAIGAVGVLGAVRLGRLVAFSVIASMGTLLIAIALFTPVATVAALYYLVHSTFAAAALFLVVDLTTRARGSVGDALGLSYPIPASGLVASLFFAGAIAMAGMPPLSGFVGKLLVLDAARGVASAGVIWAAILVTSLVIIVGFARAGSVLFWKPAALIGADGTVAGAPKAPPPPGLAVTAAMIPVVAFVAATVFAGPLTAYAEAVADQLYGRTGYIDAVLGDGASAPLTASEEATQ